MEVSIASLRTFAQFFEPECEVVIDVILQYGRGQAQERRPGRDGRYVGEVYALSSSVVASKTNVITLFCQPE